MSGSAQVATVVAQVEEVRQYRKTREERNDPIDAKEKVMSDKLLRAAESLAKHLTKGNATQQEIERLVVGLDLYVTTYVRPYR